MRRRVISLLAGAALIGGSLFLPRLVGFAGAADSGGGMCSGRIDAGFGISASANGSGGAPTFALNVNSDNASHISGSMSFQGNGFSLSTQDWCRVWQHRPGDVPESGKPYPEGAMTAHALGYATLGDGTTVLARADVRQLADGKIIYRVRYQPARSHGESPGDMGTTTTVAAATTVTSTTEAGPTTTVAPTTTQAASAGDEGGSSGGEGDEGAWIWVTPKGQWLPLDSMQLTGNVVYPQSTTTSTSAATTTTPSSTTSSTTSTTAGPVTTTTAPPAAAGASTAGPAQESATVTVPATNTGMPWGANGWRVLSLVAGLAGLMLLLPPRMRPSLARVRRNGVDKS